MRFLGILRCTIKSFLEKEEISEELYKKYDSILLVEMIYRSIKTHFDFCLRRGNTYLPIEDEYRRSMIKMVEQLDDDNDKIWKDPNELKQIIQFKFGDYALTEDELKEEFNLKSKLNKEEFHSMLSLYCNISGSHVSSDIKINIKMKSIYKWEGFENEFIQHQIKSFSSDDFKTIETELLGFIPKIHTFRNWDTVFMFLKRFMKVSSSPENMKKVLDVVQENSYLWNDQDFLEDFILNFILTTIKKKFPTLISNQIIQNLPQPKNIKVLDLSGCICLDDEAFNNCMKISNLTHLNLSGTKITNEGIKKIAKLGQFLNFEEIDITNCPNITEEGIALLNFCEVKR